MAKKKLTQEEIKAFLSSTQSKKNEFIEKKMLEAITEVEEPIQQVKALETIGRFSNNAHLLASKRPVDFYDEKIQLAFQVLLNIFYESMEKAKIPEVSKQVINSYLNQQLFGFEEKMEKMTKGVISEATKKAVAIESDKYIKQPSNIGDSKTNNKKKSAYTRKSKKKR